MTLGLASQTPLTEEDLEDCLQNSLIKLLKAAKIYDPWFEAKPTANPDKAARFSTIAFPYIQSGLKSSEPEFQSITLPRGMADRARRYRRNSDLREQLGLSLDHQDISDAVAKKEGLQSGPSGLSTIAKNLQLALNAGNVISLDDPYLINFVSEDRGEPTQIEVDRGELLPDQTPDVEEIFANQNELKKKCIELLNH